MIRMKSTKLKVVDVLVFDDSDGMVTIRDEKNQNCTVHATDLIAKGGAKSIREAARSIHNPRKPGTDPREVNPRVDILAELKKALDDVLVIKERYQQALDRIEAVAHAGESGEAGRDSYGPYENLTVLTR